MDLEKFLSMLEQCDALYTSDEMQIAGITMVEVESKEYPGDSMLFIFDTTGTLMGVQ